MTKSKKDCSLADKPNLRVCVSGGHRSGNDKIYEEEAYNMGRIIAKLGFRLDYGFSDSGIMGAVARGVLENWEEKKDKYYRRVKPIVGVTTLEYYELYTKNEMLKQVSEIVLTDTLENRKIRLLEADFVVFTPGGVGTFDELAYDCVAMQDGYLDPKPFIMYNINGFFYHVLEYLKVMAKREFSSPIPFIVVDNSEELEVAFRLLKLKYDACKDMEEAYTQARELAYELPYYVKKWRENEDLWVEHILEHIQEVNKHGSKAEKEQLQTEIDKAYLEKETERMFERMALSIEATATLSDKMKKLKRRTKA